ncbi:ABATE domain-containing protein, partial [Streptomyces scabiei]|uniref:ABATE domain-containing protein n=1 Tax=Streptomyces scabiei TaxID=1930 RepID=UPI0029905A65
MGTSSRASASGQAPGVSGIRLRSYSGNVFRFDPGALCLELLVTGGPGALTRYEVLHTPGDLVAWAEQSRLTPTPPALRVTDDEVVHARRLRDALTRTVVSRVAQPPGVHHLVVRDPQGGRRGGGPGSYTQHTLPSDRHD